MQIELVEMQRRVQARVPLPWIQPDAEWLDAQQAAGRPVVRFSDIPLEWSDFRLTFRQTADILHRFEALDRADHEQILGARAARATRSSRSSRQWYIATSGVERKRSDTRAPAGDAPGEPRSGAGALAAAVPRALRRGLLPRPEFDAWRHGHCPICGWEPDFAVITPSAERRLICGRCLGQWTFDSVACPFCANDDRALITSFATRDGRYRVYACDVCRRYLKAYDARNARAAGDGAVDTIATLPLDAAAMQQGYRREERV